MANQITGKILCIYPTETITGKSGKSIDKRSIVIDCTRFDPYTGERGFENTPQLEFVGDRCRELDIYQPGQIVTITFDVNGSRYTTADGREQIFTRVQPYRIEAKQVQHMHRSKRSNRSRNISSQRNKFNNLNISRDIIKISLHGLIPTDNRFHSDVVQFKQ